MLEEARRLQERMEKRMHSNKPYSLNIKFTEKEKTTFFIIFTICYGIAAIMLFQIEFLRLYATDFWLLPIGVGSTAFFFFLIS